MAIPITYHIRNFILPIFVLFCLAACTPYTPPEQEATDQHFDDTRLTAKVKEVFISHPQIQTDDINVETVRGVVQLSGFAESERNKAEVVQLAQNVEGVRNVSDDIMIRDPWGYDNE